MMELLDVLNLAGQGCCPRDDLPVLIVPDPRAFESLY